MKLSNWNSKGEGIFNTEISKAQGGALQLVFPVIVILISTMFTLSIIPLDTWEKVSINNNVPGQNIFRIGPKLYISSTIKTYLDRP